MIEDNNFYMKKVERIRVKNLFYFAGFQNFTLRNNTIEYSSRMRDGFHKALFVNLSPNLCDYDEFEQFITIQNNLYYNPDSLSERGILHSLIYVDPKISRTVNVIFSDNTYQNLISHFTIRVCLLLSVNSNFYANNERIINVTVGIKGLTLANTFLGSNYIEENMLIENCSVV